MRVEAGGGREPFVADLADVRLLPRVGPHVPLQQTGTVERFAADGAGKHRLLAGAPARDAGAGWDGADPEWPGETPGQVGRRTWGTNSANPVD